MVRKPPLDGVINTMLGVLDGFFTPALPNVGDRHVSVAGMDERNPGFGARIGNISMGALGSVAVGAIWLEGAVRFEMRSNSSTNVADAASILHNRLMAAKPDLRQQGFLNFRHRETSAANPPLPFGTWSKHAVYQVLYEHRFLDSDGAESLVVRIPIDTDNEDAGNREEGIVRGNLQRWDELTAPNLVLNGPRRIERLALSIHYDTALPTGRVTLLRTHDGADNPPDTETNLDDFLTAIDLSLNPEPHVAVTWNTVGDYRDALHPEGEPITFYDRDPPHTARVYTSYAREFRDQPIILPGHGDRLVLYHGPAPGDTDTPLNSAGVIYLRAG